MAKVALTPKAQEELAEMMLAIGHSPKHRKAVTKALAEVIPGYELPADVRNADVAESVDERFAERDRKDAERETLAKLERQRKGLLDGTLIEGRQYTEEQIKEIEEVMKPRGITDYESGALIYAGSQKPASPTPEIPSRGQWEFPKVKNPFDSTALTMDARKQAFDVINELNARRRA